MARAEVGRVGVAIDTADDMVDLFAGLPLDQVSVNFTINATAPIILAIYLAAAERQGVRPEKLTGTLQNDILKEFLARKAYVFPPSPSHAGSPRTWSNSPPASCRASTRSRSPGTTHARRAATR